MYSKLTDGGFMVCGYVSRDAEVTRTKNGGAFTRWSVAAAKQKQPDGTEQTMWTSCQSFRSIAATIKKGDTVLAVGRIETSEHNGKTYKNLVCEFVQIMQKAAPPQKPEESISAENDLSEFEEILDDGEVPF